MTAIARMRANTRCTRRSVANIGEGATGTGSGTSRHYPTMAFAGVCSGSVRPRAPLTVEEL